MPYTIEDYKRETAQRYLAEMPAQEQLAVVEELLQRLSPEQIEAYLKRLRKGSPVPKKKKRSRGVEPLSAR